MDRRRVELVRQKLEELIRQLEMVYRTSRSADQKKRVSKQLSELKKDLTLLTEGGFSEQDLKRYFQGEGVEDEFLDEDEDETGLGGFPLLSSIEIKPACPESREHEINVIASLLAYFEQEYLSVLGNYQLKLDFNHAQKRDSFFSVFGSLQQALKSYLDIVQDIARGQVVSGEHIDSLNQMKRKLFIDLIIKLGDFTKSFYEFLDDLVLDYNNGGNLILNPEQILEFDPLQGNRELDGLQVVEGIERIRLFLGEFSEYLRIPDFK